MSLPWLGMCLISLNSLNCIIAFAAKVVYQGSHSPSHLGGIKGSNHIPGEVFFVMSQRNLWEGIGYTNLDWEMVGSLIFPFLGKKKKQPRISLGRRRGRFSPLLSVSQFVESDATPGVSHQPGSSLAANERPGRVDGCALISSAAFLWQERPHFHLLWHFSFH